MSETPPPHRPRLFSPHRMYMTRGDVRMLHCTVSLHASIQPHLRPGLTELPSLCRLNSVTDPDSVAHTHTHRKDSYRPYTTNDRRKPLSSNAHQPVQTDGDATGAAFRLGCHGVVISYEILHEVLGLHLPCGCGLVPEGSAKLCLDEAMPIL